MVDIDEDDEDTPLVRAPKKTPKKKKEKTISESSVKGAGSQSESDGETMSRARRDGARLKSPVNYCEDDDSPPPPHTYSATASAAFKKGKAGKMKSPPQTLNIKKIEKPSGAAAMASAASPPPKNAAAVVSRIKSPVYYNEDDDSEDSPPPPQKSHKKAEAATMKSPPHSSVTSKKAVNPVNAGNPFSLAMNFSAAKSPPQKASKEMEKQQSPKAVVSPPPKPANLVVKPPVVSPPPKPTNLVKSPVVSPPPKPQEAPKAVVLPPKSQEPPKAVVSPPPKPQQLPQAVYSPPPKPPQAVVSPPPKSQQAVVPPQLPQKPVVSQLPKPQQPPQAVFSPPPQHQQPQKVVSSTPKPVNMEKNFMEKQSPTPLTSTLPSKHAEERKEQSPFAKTTKPVDEQPLNLVSPPSKPSAKFEEKPQLIPSSLTPTNPIKASEKEPLSKAKSIFSPAISMVDQHKSPPPKIIEEKVMASPIAKSTGNVENLKKMFSQSPAKPVIAKPPQDISHLYRASSSDPSKPKEKEQTYAQFMAAKNMQQKEQTPKEAPKVTLSPSPPKPQIVEKAQPLHSIPKPKEIPEKKSTMFGSPDAAVGGKKNQDLVSNKPTISFQSKPEASKEVKVAAEMDLKTNKCITTAAADKEKSVQKNTSSRARAASPPQPPRPHPKKAAIAAQPPAKIDYNKKEAELDETDEILVEENVTFSEVFEEDYDSEEKEDNSPKTDRSKNSPVSNRSSIEAPEKPVDKSTFRTMKRLGSTQSNQEKPREKRKWGDSKKTIQPSIDTRKVSSSELKDIIPDIKPVLEEIKHEQEEGQKMETETSDVDSDDVSKEQPAEVLKRGEKTRENAGGEKAFTVTAPASTELLRPLVEDAKDKLTSNSSDKNKNQSRVVEVRNLVRPFTNNQLINLLKRTGGFDEKIEFWIDKIKSHALVKYQSASEAEETVMALDGVKWPSSNQKKLIVTFSSDEHFQRQSVEAVSLSRAASESAQSSLKRSAAGGDRDAHESYGESRKRPRRDSASMHEADEEDGRDHKEKTASARLSGRGGAAAAGGATATEAEKEAKSLEVLFKKTKALPSIYWMPKADSSSSS